MIDLCQPWRKNQEKRLVKTPKPYLIDTGVSSFLQGLTVEKLLSDPLLTGHILENFVWSELKKQSTWSKVDYVNIYNFRTSANIEVDLVLEDLKGRVVGIEVKNSNTVTPSDFKGLAYLRDDCGEKFVRGVILYTGNQYIPLGNKLAALPISSLWQRYD